MKSKHYCILLLLIPCMLQAQEKQSLNNRKIDGYRGIWFELNQKYDHGDKYSGGLGTYTAKHIPLAIYAPKVDKTFFVYGGTTDVEQKHLLCMIGEFDHRTHKVSKPTVVYDKLGVDDPGQHLAMIRSWKTTTMLVKKGVFTKLELSEIRSFCQERSFDMVYCPGITEDEVNRFNLLEEPYFYRGTMALLGEERDGFFDQPVCRILIRCRQNRQTSPADRPLTQG